MRPSLNKVTFFNYVRRLPFGGKLTTEQVRGMEAILSAFTALGFIDLRWLAYALATAFRETGGTMQPVREAYGTSTADTIARLDKAWAKGQLKSVKRPYWRDGFFGRGLVQLTWEDNYRKMGGLLGLDLVADPDKAMDLELAARILLVGMVRGVFSGKKLEDYFGNTVSDPVGARAIVNGRDKANLIATYFKAFKDALDAASTLTPQPTDVTVEDAKPDDVPAAKSGSVGTIALSTGGAALTSLVAAVQNPWALAAFGLIVIAGGVFGWLVWSGRLTILKGKAVTP